MVDLSVYRTFAESIARQAGAIIKQNFTLGITKQWKEDGSPVTQTDTTINNLVLNEIKKNFPTHGILSEESSEVTGNSEYIWVCDPIDGTVPFAHGIPVSTFVLALTKNGKSILGVVYDPFLDRLYLAEEGKGAYLNNKRIYVSTTNELDKVVADAHLSSRANFDIAELVYYLSNEKKTILIKEYSINYSSMLVAAGQLAFTIFTRNTAHDGAAVKIIVEEAGGKVTDLFGNEQRYDTETNGFIASNGVLHEQLVDLSKKLIKPSNLS